ncbi:ATP-binding protein [Kitasatospora sp. NBC_00374]|uniref:sensor histidine kinase n=1 Tax=Kitasatospora sp. NBC_00374 TaxID=2975964 RepID=UPI0030E163E7
MGKTYIDTEADRLTRLIVVLLDLSRMQAGQVPVTLRPVAVGDVVAAAVAALPGSSVPVETEIAEDLPGIEADPGLLERALANVLANARTWSPPGTAVRVDAGVVEGRVEIRVIDRGRGIERDRRDDLFQPFRQAQGSTPGTAAGLGLAVAKGFTEAMHGELGVDDTPGGGTTFVFGLRIAAS